MEKKKISTYKFFFLASIFNTDIWFACLAEDLKREVLEIRLNLCIVELATNETFCIENTRNQILISSENMNGKKDLRIMGVHGDLVLCSIADQALVVREGDVGRCCAISLIVCNDFYAIILPHTHTTKRKVSTLKRKNRFR